jgi:biopolymer transport protein ExbB
MWRLFELGAALREFFESGGTVLVAIFVVTFVMWTLILERYWYLHTVHRRAVQEVTQQWGARRERRSWYAHQVRRAMVSRVALDLDRSIPFIRTLVALCPLLGLLGTVTGMIEVFDVMAIAGSGNPRAMAAGVSRATIPTMAGMVAALSGLLFSVQLERRSKSEAGRVADRLAPEG